MTCVLCDLKCIVCFELSTNCSLCTANSTTYASFLIPWNFTCTKVCPVGTYANTTDRTCYLCDPACLSCAINSTYCYSCDTSLNYAWLNYKCESPCPVGTFLSANLTNCTACSIYCTACSGTATNCSACTPNGTNMAYYLNNFCYQACPPTYYGDPATITCKSCDPSCTLCTGNP